MPVDLSNRLGCKAWQQRQRIENSVKHIAKGKKLKNPPPWCQYRILKSALRISGLWGVTYKQYLNPIVERNTFHITDLKSDLNGFKILQISDLHLDLDPAYLPSLVECIKALEYDLCVLTGDFQNSFNAADQVVSLIRPLLDEIRTQVFAVPGNHDTSDLISKLETAGLPFLLNENIPLKIQKSNFYLCGVDDPIYYRSHNLAKARLGVPEKELTILLSHVPTTGPEASVLGYDIQLSGHTHGGQICLPGGIPIAKGSSPRTRIKGPWQEGNLQGYTSSGVGASHIPARLFCPSEITLHTLRVVN